MAAEETNPNSNPDFDANNMDFPNRETLTESNNPTPAQRTPSQSVSPKFIHDLTTDQYDIPTGRDDFNLEIASIMDQDSIDGDEGLRRLHAFCEDSRYAPFESPEPPPLRTPNLGRRIYVQNPTANSINVEQYNNIVTKYNDMATKFDTVKQVCEDVGSNIVDFANDQKVLLTNQEILYQSLLECQNEIKRAKLYARNRQKELIKDTFDWEYEKSILIIYDIPDADWDNAMDVCDKKPFKAIHSYAVAFVHRFWREYNPRDIRATKLKQDASNPRGFWRMMLRLGSPSCATFLARRCLDAGFNALRSGLSKLQRDLCGEVEAYVKEQNELKGPNSETYLKRKFLCKVAIVRRSDKKVVGYEEYHNSSEPYMASKFRDIRMIRFGENNVAAESQSAQRKDANHKSKNLPASGNSETPTTCPTEPANSSKPGTVGTSNSTKSSSALSGSCSALPNSSVPPTKPPNNPAKKLIQPSIFSSLDAKVGGSRKRGHESTKTGVSPPNKKYNGTPATKNPHPTKGKPSGQGGGSDSRQGPGRPRRSNTNTPSSPKTPAKLSAAQIKNMKAAEAKRRIADLQAKLKEKDEKLDEATKKVTALAEVEKENMDLKEQVEYSRKLASQSSTNA